MVMRRPASCVTVRPLRRTQDAGRRTQHAARSTQHAARSTQHSVLRPLRPPLTPALVSHGAAYVLHRALGADDQAQQRAQPRLVVCAPGSLAAGERRDWRRDLEQQRRAAARHAAAEIATDQAADLTQRERASEQARQRAHEPARRLRDRLVGALGQILARGAEYYLGVRPSTDEPRKRLDLVVRHTLAPAHGVGVAADLRLHGVAEAESLVAQLVDE